MRSRLITPALAGLGLIASLIAVTKVGAQTKPSAPPSGKPAAAQPGQPTVPPPALPAAPKKHSPPITALAFSADGKQLAVGSYGGVVLYDTSTWNEISTFKQVSETVRSLAFQPGGTLLAIGSGLPGRTGAITLWDTTGAAKPYTYASQGDTVESVAFNKAGQEILLGANDNKAHLYTTLNSNTGTPIDAHNGRVTAVAFSPTAGTIYVTGGMDKIVKVWVEKTGQNVCNFDQCDSGLTGLVFLNNGTQFVGSGLDGKLYWWGVSHDDRKNTYGGYFFRQFEAHPGGIYALSGSANGQRIITGGADKMVCVWNPDNGQKIKAFNNSQSAVYAVALNQDGKIAAAGGRDGDVLIWDVEGGKLTNTVTPPTLVTRAPVPAPAPAKAPTKGKKAH